MSCAINVKFNVNVIIVEYFVNSILLSYCKFKYKNMILILNKSCRRRYVQNRGLLRFVDVYEAESEISLTTQYARLIYFLTFLIYLITCTNNVIGIYIIYYAIFKRKAWHHVVILTTKFVILFIFCLLETILNAIIYDFFQIILYTY